jgi:hypothetical protein
VTSNVARCWSLTAILEKPASSCSIIANIIIIIIVDMIWLPSFSITRMTLYAKLVAQTSNRTAYSGLKAHDTRTHATDIPRCRAIMLSPCIPHAHPPCPAGCLLLARSHGSLTTPPHSYDHPLCKSLSCSITEDLRSFISYLASPL